MNDPDQIPPDDDPERIMLDGLPEDRTIYVDNASPALWELVQIALKLERQGTLESLLRVARMARDR